MNNLVETDGGLLMHLRPAKGLQTSAKRFKQAAGQE